MKHWSQVEGRRSAIRHLNTEKKRSGFDHSEQDPGITRTVTCPLVMLHPFAMMAASPTSADPPPPRPKNKKRGPLAKAKTSTPPLIIRRSRKSTRIPIKRTHSKTDPTRTHHRMVLLAAELARLPLTRPLRMRKRL